MVFVTFEARVYFCCEDPQADSDMTKCRRTIIIDAMKSNRLLGVVSSIFYNVSVPPDNSEQPCLSKVR